MDKVCAITIKRHPVKDYKLQVGDTAKMFLRITEGSKERIQVFEGLVLKIQGNACHRSVTIRKMSGTVGVEKTIPLASPSISNVEIVSKAKVRRARLFYLRKLRGRSARLKTQS